MPMAVKMRCWLMKAVEVFHKNLPGFAFSSGDFLTLKWPLTRLLLGKGAMGFSHSLSKRVARAAHAGIH